ncbi:MAG TPA: hypothetical protein VFG99_11410 [Chloroflexia bacterium]|nr:hypothetical protein [Chloroflexia bacterium]
MIYLHGQHDEIEEDLLPANTASSTNLLPGARLRPSQFISQVGSDVMERLGASGLEFHVRARSRLVQFWSGDNASVHYEVWVHEREARLEIGFHLEAEEAHNAAVYRELDRCLLDVQFQLGGSVWLELWDKGWVRLYETQPLWPLDTARAEETAERTVAFVQVVQPLYGSILERLAE